MQITTFLMFTGRAEEAMTFYASLFPDSRITSIVRYGEGETGAAGTVHQAILELAGMRLMCIDSPVKHAFDFTPSISLFVNCDDVSQLDRLVGALSLEGQMLMPPDNYGFSKKFAWVQDRFGVSWQLNLP